jgi:hypothetical protein
MEFTRDQIRLVKSWAKSLIQYSISIVGLYYVFKGLEMEKMKDLILEVRFFPLLIGLFFFNVSKLFSAIRQSRIFSCIGIEIPFLENLKLYYIGMFYNLIFPGGVGGDGYKVYLVRRSHGKGVRSLLGTTILDRITGLVVLLGILQFLLPLSGIAFLKGHFEIWLALIPEIFIYYWAFRIWFKPYFPAFLSLHIYSGLVQGMQLICVAFLLEALPGLGFGLDYWLLFLISSVAAVIPLTVGGLGARELVSVKLAPFMDTSVQAALTVSLIFFILTLVSSLPGIFLRYGKPSASPKHSPGH